MKKKSRPNSVTRSITVPFTERVFRAHLEDLADWSNSVDETPEQKAEFQKRSERLSKLYKRLYEKTA